MLTRAKLSSARKKLFSSFPIGLFTLKVGVEAQMKARQREACNLHPPEERPDDGLNFPGLVDVLVALIDTIIETILQPKARTGAKGVSEIPEQAAF